MGSNMAECHPVAFRWPMKAKLNGAKPVHIDPRFTRTSAVADLHVPIRAGSDIAFLGGIINHVVNSERWKSEPFFRDYTVNYTNLATIVNESFQDTEDLEGVFSGLLEYKEPDFWPYNGNVGRYDNTTWQYDRGPKPPGPATEDVIKNRGSFDDLLRSLRKGTPRTDPTLQHPRCVFQLLKKHFSRYTPEMVEQICGCPKEKFVRVAEMLLENSGPDRTSAFAYAVAWTQHTYGVQIISCCALLSQLTGNMGRPGGGIMALRGHAAIQGSTDVPTLYHSIHGYLNAPSAVRPHDSLRAYLAAETPPTGYWANGPKWMVSYLKSVYGDAATPENDFGYDWHPKILGDHSHMATFAAMNEGKVRGTVVVGQNPATSLNGTATRRALRQLEWLVVKDNWLTETATYWYQAPEVKSGEVKVGDIKTEVFFFPSTQIAEYDGSYTNTQRMLQWHSFAAKAPGDCRTDSWFYHNLAKRRKKAYADSTLPRDQRAQSAAGDQRLRDGQPGAAPARLRGAQGRRLDDMRVVDLLRVLPGLGSEPHRPARARSSRRAGRASQVGLGMARQPARHLQPRRRGSAGQPVERAQALGVVGSHGRQPARSGHQEAGSARQVGRLRRAGLPPHRGPEPQGQARRHHHGAALGNGSVHHAAGREGVDLRPERAGGRALPDVLRAARVAGRQSPVPEAAREPRAQGLVAGQALEPARLRRRREVPLRHHDLPADRALPLGFDEPLAAVARRAATGAVHRDRYRAGPGEEHQEPRLGGGLESARTDPCQGARDRPDRRDERRRETHPPRRDAVALGLGGAFDRPGGQRSHRLGR